MKRKKWERVVWYDTVLTVRAYSTTYLFPVPALRGPVPRASLKAIFVSISIYIIISISQVSNNSQVAN